MKRSGLGLGSGINAALPEVTEKNMKNFRTIRVPKFRNGKLPDKRQKPDRLSLRAWLVSAIIYYINRNVSILKDTLFYSVPFICMSSVKVGGL